MLSPTDDVKSKLDIIDVVSPCVSLQKSGGTHKAKRPFHEARAPSFVVSPERQSWRCFGICAEGDDVFSFVMRAENMEFGDALRTRARRALQRQQRRRALLSASARVRRRGRRQKIPGPPRRRAGSPRKVQARLQPRLARDFVLALDPDAAGKQATLRSLETSWSAFRTMAARDGERSSANQWKPPSLKIAEIPDCMDPDALISKRPQPLARRDRRSVAAVGFRHPGFGGARGLDESR